MIKTLEAGRLFQVTGYPRTEINDDISAAVEMVRDYSMTEGWQGILVTRHERFLYTVNLSFEVPYGITAERDLWSQTTGQSSSATPPLDTAPSTTRDAVAQR
jgi:hypothetical protein